MNEPTKDSFDKKLNVVQEPEAIYVSVELNQDLQEKNIVCFDMDGNSIAKNDFANDINQALYCLANGTLETYSSEEVQMKILG